MTKLMTVARQFHNDEDGAAMVEYTVLLGIITVAAIAIIGAVGAWVSGSFTTLCGKLTVAATGTDCVKPTG